LLYLPAVRAEKGFYTLQSLKYTRNARAKSKHTKRKEGEVDVEAEVDVNTCLSGESHFLHGQLR